MINRQMYSPLTMSRRGDNC
uniref:Uncharacterized protein n=1 Tax=Rhizophora mucronata TaxID=61149 RepID=A0A2P2QZ65_RHIMU